jgi:hypothetical protein
MADLRTSGSARSLPASVVAGAGAALAIAALWVGLTALTGKTYHLAPGVTAWAPGLTVSLLRGDNRQPHGSAKRLALLASALGPIAVGAAWAAIGLAGIEPSATIFAHQPGGVGGEVIVATLAGALLGARRVTRASRQAPRKAGP